MKSFPMKHALAVILAAIKAVDSSITEAHREKARAQLDMLRKGL